MNILTQVPPYVCITPYRSHVLLNDHFKISAQNLEKFMNIVMWYIFQSVHSAFVIHLTWMPVFCEFSFGIESPFSIQNCSLAEIQPSVSYTSSSSLVKIVDIPS